MAKCWKCGRGGLLLQVGKSGLCIDCLEAANEAALATIAELRKGGEARRHVLDILDVETAKDVAMQAVTDLSNSEFSMWDAAVHVSPDQLSRIRRSASVRIISFDQEAKAAVVAGSKGSTYTTTFERCSCGDFIARRLPCKHMYKLAALHGGVDFSQYLE